MADNKSSEENILYHCVKCNRHRVIKNGIDGNSCNYCDGYLIPIGPTNLPTTKEGRKSIHYGDITVTADVSDALKGLKAVQREARKATAALKELEEQQKKINPESTTVIIDGKSIESCPKCGENIPVADIYDGTPVINCKKCGWLAK